VSPALLTNISLRRRRLTTDDCARCAELAHHDAMWCVRAHELE
jgi:hypothetical protein